MATEFRPNRKPPVPQPAKPKRKGLRRVSPKRAKLMREIRDQRRAITDSLCMVCRANPSSDPHEIARGAAREACLTVPLLQIGCCRQCHDRIQNLPATDQIAIKIRYLIDLACQSYVEIVGRNVVCSEDVISRLMFTNLPETK